MSDAFLYPNVTSLPGQQGVNAADKPDPKKQPGAKSDFDQVYDQAVTAPQGSEGSEKTLKTTGTDLGAIKSPLKFSAHAAQRLQDRKIALDAPTMVKVNNAIDKAAAKGVDDTLILTKDAALIVSVKNRTVITAMDRASLAGNVFTNIDGAVII